MTKTLLLGVDAGQTVTKAVLFDATGAAVGTGRLDTPVSAPRPGWYERDMARLWDDTAIAIVGWRALIGWSFAAPFTAPAAARRGPQARASRRPAYVESVRVIRRHQPRPSAAPAGRFEWYTRLARATSATPG